MLKPELKHNQSHTMLTAHSIFILKIFKNNIAYFSLVEYSTTHRYMLILLTLALIKR